MANVVFYLALPVNTRLQVGLPQAKSPQHITACHTHLKMKCLQKKLIYRDFFPTKVSHCSLKNIVSPPVVRPKPLSPKPILDLPLLRRRHDSSLAWKQLCFKETKVISIHNEYLQNPIQIQYFMFHYRKEKSSPNPPASVALFKSLQLVSPPSLASHLSISIIGVLSTRNIGGKVLELN